MDKDDNYSAPMPPSFNAIDYSLDHQQHQQYHHNHEQQEQQFMTKFRVGETLGDNSNVMVDYMLNNTQQQAQPSSAFYGSSSFDKFSFADVMQFADFGPKLALNQTKNPEEEPGLDPVYFLKFPVLNDKSDLAQNLMANPSRGSVDHVENHEDKLKGLSVDENSRPTREEERVQIDEDDVRASDTNSVQLRFLGEDLRKNSQQESKNKRKRPRTIKTIEEVESQRMTHIAVERNRRKQMNEHLRVLRSLMPGSYVQRGDQASIIGGAIEFVRELEQLLQCLESQKRRRLFGEGAATTRPAGDSSSTLVIQQSNQSPFFPPLPIPNDQMKLAMELETGLREETAENKSCLADVEVKLLGFDAMIKILSRRRPGQLIKTIAALEDLQLNILHTNITTIEQTVLYSFNVKVASDSRVTAEDIASSVQQIFSFIHANSGM